MSGAPHLFSVLERGVLIPAALLILDRGLRASGVVMDWLPGLALAIALYGVADALIQGVGRVKAASNRAKLVCHVAGYANTVIFLILVSGPLYGGAPGSLGLHMRLEGFPITELWLGGDVRWLLLVLLVLRLKPLMEFLGHRVLHPHNHM